MSDDQSMSGMDPVSFEEPSVLPAGPKPPRGTAGRNILLVVAAVILLAAIVGVVGYVIFNSQSVAPVVVTTPTTTVTTSSTATSSSLVATSEIADVSNDDVFSPHNPFEVIAPPTIGSEESSDTSTTTTTTKTTTTKTKTTSSSSSESSTTLTLSSIITQDGVKYAVVKLGGTSYTVAEGDTVGSSSWQVVTINTTSVDFLYGDESITISLGEATSG